MSLDNRQLFNQALPMLEVLTTLLRDSTTNEDGDVTYCQSAVIGDLVFELYQFV